jgi:hypothetical protein
LNEFELRFDYFREDIDSGSSIPPLSPPYNQHHAIFSDDEKAYSPTSSTATTTISTIELPKRVVYSREDILHENAGKGGVHSARRFEESVGGVDGNFYDFHLVLGSRNEKCGRG